MQFRFITLCFTLLLVSNISAQLKTIEISEDFDKVIISPHISAVFVQGNENKVTIEDSSIDVEKLHTEIKNGTLQVYAEGAKTLTKHKKVKHKNWENKVPIYRNRVANVIVTYKDVEIFSIRGEEKHYFKSTLEQEKCIFRIYGASEISINEIKAKELRVTIYGESVLNIDAGNVTKQRYTAYGESIVSAESVTSKQTKLTAYGDGTFKFNASERFKVTSYGEATILYKGKAELRKGLVFGESTIRSID